MFLPRKLFPAIASSEFCHQASFLIGNAFLYHIVHSTSQPILLLVIVIFQFHLLEYFLQCHQLHILRCPNCDFNAGAILLLFCFLSSSELMLVHTVPCVCLDDGFYAVAKTHFLDKAKSTQRHRRHRHPAIRPSWSCILGYNKCFLYDGDC